jgi:hypothetical protein
MENIVIFNELRLTLDKTARGKMNFNCNYERKKVKSSLAPMIKIFISAGCEIDTYEHNRSISI